MRHKWIPIFIGMTVGWRSEQGGGREWGYSPAATLAARFGSTQLGRGKWQV